ncbi:hypothetical protein [Roseibium sp.]|uniref:hypothetical protein n=1 Tax=Roseibium sp. TaxID=1936156 RepID=UPI003B51A9B1
MGQTVELKNPTPEIDDPEYLKSGRNFPTLTFLVAGLLFLLVAISLFGLGGFSLYQLINRGPIIEIQVSDGLSPAVTSHGDVTQLQIYNFYGRIIGFFTGPVLLVLSGILCSFIGIRLLKSAGAITEEVIPERDYKLLAPAIREGDQKAITEYIRLRSLSGVTGAFTKIGLTGLPLATIFLTIVLAGIGIFHDKFFDLAQLTLGAFIGSYVQKQGEIKGTEKGDGNP